MAKNMFLLILGFYWAIMGLQSWATTDVSEVQALQNLYRSLNKPMQLEHWKEESGDPCAEPWTGVQCIGSSIIDLKLHGLGLTGSIGFELSNLKSLKKLDLSSNDIEGSIPYSLPPNLTHLNFAENKFSQSFPYSIEKMKHLQHLNLSHNSLSGSLGNVFAGLESLEQMDLSFNSFTGDLPISVKSMSNLKSLFLQSNQFTGSVIFLASLTLIDLNIEDNHFSGVIPEHFQNITNLWFGGNEFVREANYPPWNFPTESMPKEQNSSAAVNFSAFENNTPQMEGGHKSKKLGAGVIVLIIGGIILVGGSAALTIVHRQRSFVRKCRSTVGREDSMKSLPTNTLQDYTSVSGTGSPHTSGFSSSPMITPSRLPAVRTRTLKLPRRKSFTKSKMAAVPRVYTIAELQIATNSFGEEHFIGEGSLGSVYKAHFPDGTVVAVKNIKTVPLSIIEEQQFFDVIKNISRLKHPNIVPLLGYSMEHGQHLLVYEFIRNLTLDDALHCVAYKPLNWGARLQIALGVARALDYMHSSFVPPIPHSNLKAANILLDEEFKPHVCDCSLAILRPLSRNTVKLKASEMAIADSGYIAPDNLQPSSGNSKADVYAFGVLLLEILTGRKPFDNTRAPGEQSLATWAASRLHDGASLAQMVDPAVKNTIPSKSLSRFADVVSMCIQEFRPQIGEIVDSLSRLLNPTAADVAEADFERSFRSTSSKFFGSSPTQSYYSV
ncbi:protein STRUBBELIG-RECEPTOR FAMILY 2 isoform X2 [Salvia miltiorrhiza]|uniref:protein STRUBBELIG-RECEPTOR FAMILY 2 isoform X2 n=1 Tax=Salvia miltiorrhiza TaxID=226208 RepID=UPI0025AB9759|nr:protein STRUBBELIG-RECEPTOR FAMILY 2 isoform X2 [Salvia miltiorrhiza]